MAIPPQNPKEAFEAIAKRRSDEAEALRVQQIERQKQEAELSGRQQQAYLGEETAAKERGAEREEWRQEKHEKAREAIAEEQKKQLELQRIEAQKAKVAEEQKKRDENLAMLHKKAVEKRAAMRIESAKVEEERQKKIATVYEARTTDSLDIETERDIDHLQKEARRKKEALQNDLIRTKEKAEETFKDAKNAAVRTGAEALRKAKTEEEKRAARVEESHALSLAEAAYRRALIDTDATVQQEQFDIDTETKRLTDEIRRNADAKKRLTARDAERKRTDAQARREGVEEWFGRGKEKKDSKDPMS